MLLGPTNPLFAMPSLLSPFQTPQFKPFTFAPLAQPATVTPQVSLPNNGSPASSPSVNSGGFSPGSDTAGQTGVSAGSATGSGVAPAGTSGGYGIPNAGLLGLGLAAIGAPPGLMGAINTGLSVSQADNDLAGIGAKSLGLGQIASAALNGLTGGMLGTDVATAAAQNALGTNAAMGIGVPTGSVDMADHSDSDAAAGSGDVGTGDAPGSDGSGDANGNGAFAKGGMITKKRLKGPNPKGPDDGTITAKAGEAVLSRGAVGLLGPRIISLLNAAGNRGLLAR